MAAYGYCRRHYVRGISFSWLLKSALLYKVVQHYSAVSTRVNCLCGAIFSIQSKTTVNVLCVKAQLGNLICWLGDYLFLYLRICSVDEWNKCARNFCMYAAAHVILNLELDIISIEMSLQF